MTDAAENVMRDVWEWKRKSEQATEGLDKSALIEFYRREADEVAKKFGLNLRRQSPSPASTIPKDESPS